MTLLSLENVTKRYGHVTAVDDLTFAVDRGQVVGFLGPNGAGKSTTMRMITQYHDPDGGRILFDGMPLTEAGREAKRRVGYLPENNPLYTEMLVAEYLAFIGRLRELNGPALARATDDAVGATGIEGVFYRPIGELSRGIASGSAWRPRSFTSPTCWCSTSRRKASTPTSGSRSAT
jgi:ABC-2 type transport system ATP-binding protein